MKENTSPICVYPCPSVVKIARCSGFQGPFRTLFHRRGPLRLVSDPKTASRQGRQGREEAFEESHAAWLPLRSLREKLSVKIPVFRPGIAIFHRNLSRRGANLSRRRRERLFGLFFTCAARCGSFPIRKPPLAKDAKDAKKLSRNLTPLGALCDLCERNCPKKCRFSGRESRFFIETCHAEGVNAFSDPFSPARPVAARFRSENRLSPRTPRTRRSFRGISRRLAPFAIFARECLGKRAGNAVLKAFWSLERLLAALFRGGGPLRLVFRVRKPPFQLENRKIRPQINVNGS